MSRFDAARRAAVMGDLLRHLAGRPRRLLPFEVVRESLKLRHLVDRGVAEVPLAQVVGSLGRTEEFNRAFLPRHEALRDRWESIERLTEGSEGFPPVELYKVGDAYFVVDGHHRVSVLRAQGTPSVEARVREFPTAVPLKSDETVREVLLKRGLAEFLEVTGLEPHDDELVVSLPQGYQRLLEHICGHGYYRGLETGREPSWEETVRSWYETVYRPMVETIRHSAIMEAFPGRTVTDLYLFTMDHLHQLRGQYGEVDPEAAVEDFSQHHREPSSLPGKIRKMIGKKTTLMLAGLLLAASPSVHAADLRFATLRPTGAGHEWSAVIDAKNADGVTVWADGVPLAAEWQEVDAGRWQARLALPPGSERVAVGKRQPEAEVRVAPYDDGFGGWTIYHVMLGFFRNGNPGNDGEIEGWRHPNYAGGDLQGVREKAGYLADLGVNAVWLSPMFASRTSHGYDVTNYYRVGDAVAVPDDPQASLELFRGLVRQLGERGVRVILDLPLNHASRSYDRDAGDPGGRKPRATAARQEAEKVWESWGADYRYWSFDHEGTRRFLKDVALHWLTDEGVAGLRLDYVRGVPHDFWAELYAEVKAKKPGALMIGECWADAAGADGNAAEIARYYEPVADMGRQFDSLLDFPMQMTATDVFARGGAAAALEDRLQTAAALYGPDAWPAYFLDNHDMARFAAWTDDDRRLVAAVGFLASLSSPLVVFYGTETGLAHGAPKPGFTDAGRVPMPWDALNTALVERVAGFLRARAAHPSLTRGARLPLVAGDEVLVMAKVAPGETALVGVNLASEERVVEIAAAGLAAADVPFVGLEGAAVPRLEDGRLKWRLPALATAIVFQASE